MSGNCNSQFGSLAAALPAYSELLLKIQPHSNTPSVFPPHQLFHQKRSLWAVPGIPWSYHPPDGYLEMKWIMANGQKEAVNDWLV